MTEPLHLSQVRALKMHGGGPPSVHDKVGRGLSISQASSVAFFANVPNQLTSIQVHKAEGLELLAN